MSYKDNFDTKMIRKQNELNLYKFGQYYALKRDEEIEKSEKEYDDLPNLKELDEWFQTYVKDLEAESRKSVRRVKIKKYTSRASIAFLMLILSSAVVTMSVEAFRIKFLNLFIESGSDYNRVDFDSGNVNTDVPADWQGHYYPSYIPEGYSLLQAQENDKTKMLYYMTEGGEMLFFTQTTGEMGLNIDSEGVDIVSIPINDIDGYMIDKSGMIVISWSENGMVFTIEGEEEINTMIEIAEKIKIF